MLPVVQKIHRPTEGYLTYNIRRECQKVASHLDYLFAFQLRIKSLAEKINLVVDHCLARGNR